MPGLEMAFFGSSLLSAYWNGAATYYRGIIRALAANGHQITFYEPNAFDRQSNLDLPEPEWARVVVYEPTLDGVSQALEKARGAELVIKCSGVGVFDEFLEAEVLSLRSFTNSVAFWDVDAPATLDRVHQSPYDPFRAHIPKYDLILTYGGGDAVVNGYLQLGAQNCIPIYNAVDPDTHFQVPPQAQYASTLAFVGNRLPDREARVEEFFFRAASLLPTETFLLAGSGWADKARAENVRYVGHLPTRNHNAFNSTPLAVLNINRTSMASYGFSPPTRIFEAAGAAACLICDEWPGIEMFLTPDEEVLTARSGADVAGRLEELTPLRAREIGGRAQARVLSEHTYAHRAKQLEEVLDVAVNRNVASFPK
jgi:spore maturation protein CgeB